jgi:hypothetical protein
MRSSRGLDRKDDCIPFNFSVYFSVAAIVVNPIAHRVVLLLLQIGRIPVSAWQGEHQGHIGLLPPLEMTSARLRALTDDRRRQSGGPVKESHSSEIFKRLVSINTWFARATYLEITQQVLEPQNTKTSKRITGKNDQVSHN